MAENRNYYMGLYSLGFFLILSTLIMGTFITLVVATNDYIFFYLYDVASTMVSAGFLPAGILTNIESIATSFLTILNFIDIRWVVIFLIFVIEYVMNSYFAKREGHLSIYGFISFGIMGMLFILNFLVTYNQNIHNIFFNVILTNLNIELTFFNLYLSNFQIVNLILIVVGLIIHFIPLDLLQFKNRKSVDLINEIQ